ncbi:MAG: TatD family hydrolase [Stenotrophobium sp.]
MIDIGANLAHDSFDRDLDDVLTRAWNAGLDAIIVTGSSLASAQQAMQLARRHPQKLYATAGLHPHHANEWTPELGEHFHELAAEPEVVALGECGLDYFRDLSPRADQRRAFAAQLELAAQLHKPLFLHQRDAHADFLAMLGEYRTRLGDVVVHCFTDTRAALNDYLALDCHIGITGWICDERRGAHLIEAVRDIPDARLLIETDAPYLLPRNATHRDVQVPQAQDAQERPPKQVHRRNEPCFLLWVVKALAAARGQSEAHVANITTENARSCFGLAL